MTKQLITFTHLKWGAVIPHESLTLLTICRMLPPYLTSVISKNMVNYHKKINWIIIETLVYSKCLDYHIARLGRFLPFFFSVYFPSSRFFLNGFSSYQIKATNVAAEIESKSTWHLIPNAKKTTGSTRIPEKVNETNHYSRLGFHLAPFRFPRRFILPMARLLWHSHSPISNFSKRTHCNFQ